MEIPEQLACLYTAELTKTEEGYTLSVPAREIEQGSIDLEETVRVAVLSKSDGTTETAETTGTTAATQQGDEPTPSQPEPPVSEGETRVVEIEVVGDQGAGIRSVVRGYVVIVHETHEGETVEIHIATVQTNVAFGTVIDRPHHAG